MRRVLVGRGAADVDELLDADFFRSLEQRECAAEIDPLEGQTSFRILNRIALELHRARRSPDTGERVFERRGLRDVALKQTRGPADRGCARAFSGLRVSTRTRDAAAGEQSPRDRATDESGAAGERDDFFVHA